MDFQKVIDGVPDYQAFLTVEELDASTKALASEYPERIEVFEAGKSRKGHSILCSKVGTGEKNALCFALPHPNEPIGAMMIEYLERYLVENPDFCKELGYTWYFMKCVDPDGTKLNEGWFKGPYTIHNYMTNFFRPGSIEQVEWTFPIEYKKLRFTAPMPETQAIMNVIEQVKPEFLYSLHNAGFGGAYWYITHQYKEIYDALRDSAAKQGVALHLGEPESPSSTVFSEAIYEMLGMEEEYDYLEKYTDVSPEEVINCGTSSSDYAKRFNDCVTLLTELPYFFDERIQDLSESKMTRREAIIENVEVSGRLVEKMDELLTPIRPYLSADNPYPLLAEQLVSTHDASSEAKLEWSKQEEFDRPATISEVMDSTIISQFYSGLCIAMLSGAATYEMERYGNSAEDQVIARTLQEVKQKTDAFVKQHCEMLEDKLDYKVIPIQSLVKIQLESGLIVAKRRAEEE